MVLDISLLNTQNYKVHIKGKGEQSRERVASSSTPLCSSYWKGSFGFPSTTVTNFTFFLNICIYIYIYVCIYIYIYIVIHWQTVSLYHNSSVWLDTWDAPNWDQNLLNFMSGWWHTPRLSLCLNVIIIIMSRW